MYKIQTFPLRFIKTALGKATHDTGQVSVFILLDFSAAHDIIGLPSSLKHFLHLAFSTVHFVDFPPHFPDMLMLDDVLMLNAGCPRSWTYSLISVGTPLLISSTS